MNKIPAPYIRQILLLLLIAVLFGLLFWNLQFFIPAVLGAYTLYILSRRPLWHLTQKRGWNRKLAIAVLMILSFLIIMLPMFWVFKMLQGHVVQLLSNSDHLFTNAQAVIQSLETRYGVELMTSDNIQTLTGWGVNLAQGFINATLNGVLLVLAMYFILWFMMSEGSAMEKGILELLPLRPENVEYVRRHLHDTVRSNALGIPLMGVVQAFVALPVYFLLGIHDLWLWFAITFVAGMMPVAGVALAYVPLTLILLSQDMEGKALTIFLYGFIVLGSVDNIARMWILKKIGQTHPLITLFGAIAGVKMFGFVGFIFGPILISMAILLFRIYNKEFGKLPGRPDPDSPETHT